MPVLSTPWRHIFFSAIRPSHGRFFLYAGIGRCGHGIFLSVGISHAHCRGCWLLVRISLLATRLRLSARFSGAASTVGGVAAFIGGMPFRRASVLPRRVGMGMHWTLILLDVTANLTAGPALWRGCPKLHDLKKAMYGLIVLTRLNIGASLPLLLSFCRLCGFTRRSHRRLLEMDANLASGLHHMGVLSRDTAPSSAFRSGALLYGRAVAMGPNECVNSGAGLITARPRGAFAFHSPPLSIFPAAAQAPLAATLYGGPDWIGGDASPAELFTKSEKPRPRGGLQAGAAGNALFCCFD